MARGNQGRDIFRDDADRLRWLKTLDEACQKTGWHVHAYVLMSNHYHLLVETPEGNLVAGTKWVSHRLKMGHYTRVTQALARLRLKPGRKLKQMQQRLTTSLEPSK